MMSSNSAKTNNKNNNNNQETNIQLSLLDNKLATATSTSHALLLGPGIPGPQSSWVFLPSREKPKHVGTQMIRKLGCIAAFEDWVSMSLPWRVYNTLIFDFHVLW